MKPPEIFKRIISGERIDSPPQIKSQTCDKTVMVLRPLDYCPYRPALLTYYTSVNPLRLEYAETKIVLDYLYQHPTLRKGKIQDAKVQDYDTPAPIPCECVLKLRDVVGALMRDFPDDQPKSPFHHEIHSAVTEWRYKHYAQAVRLEYPHGKPKDLDY